MFRATIRRGLFVSGLALLFACASAPPPAPPSSAPLAHVQLSTVVFVRGDAQLEPAVPPAIAMEFARRLGERADLAFLEAVSGKLPFHIGKQLPTYDAEARLSLRDVGVDAPIENRPGQVVVDVRLRLVRKNGEAIFARAERLEVPIPELTVNPAAARDPRVRGAALEQAFELGAQRAAGWLVRTSGAPAS